MREVLSFYDNVRFQTVQLGYIMVQQNSLEEQLNKALNFALSFETLE
jgi:hypothetical protein